MNAANGTRRLLGPFNRVEGDLEVQIETLDGRVRIRIPAGTSSGRRIRVRGRGFPAAGSDAAGDLFAEVRIVVPTTLSARERELFQALRDASEFRARQ